MPVHNRRFAAPVRQFLHGMTVWRGQHVGVHSGFIRPCRASPESPIRIIQEIHGQIARGTPYLALRQESLDKKSGQEAEGSNAQSCRGNQGHDWKSVAEVDLEPNLPLSNS